MPHMDLMTEVEKLKGASLTEEEKEEVEKRKEYALLWIKRYAPEKYKFQLQENFPSEANNLSSTQKEALRKILDFVENSKNLDGQAFHAKLHEVKEELSVDPKDLFSALYLIFLGKPNGPKAGWFLSVLDKDFLIKRLREALN